VESTCTNHLNPVTWNTENTVQSCRKWPDTFGQGTNTGAIAAAPASAINSGTVATASVSSATVSL